MYHLVAYNFGLAFKALLLTVPNLPLHHMRLTADYIVKIAFNC